jgi:hypothetical protein
VVERPRAHPASHTQPCGAPARQCATCTTPTPRKTGARYPRAQHMKGRWWSHVYFCSARCEDRYELEQSKRMLSLVGSASLLAGAPNFDCMDARTLSRCVLHVAMTNMSSRTLER